LKALYLKGYINGHPVNKMLVDIGTTVNIMPYSVLHQLGCSAEDLMKTNVTLSDINEQASEAQGVNEYDNAADLNDRPKLFLSHSLSICSNLADDGKLGYGFTSTDELEEVDIGPRDKPRPTFISKKLDPSLQEPMIALLKEYSDYFAWDYTEMPGLDRSIVEHQLPLKKGFWPFQQRAHQMRTKVLEEVKKEIEKMLEAGFIRPCRYAEWISSIVPV
jgi:hypothetical protein